MSTNYVVSSGEVSSGLQIDYSGDTILVSGGTVTETTVTGGTFTVTRNGIAENTMLTGDGRMIVNSYGAAANTVMGGDGGNYNSMTLILSNANAGYTTVMCTHQSPPPCAHVCSWVKLLTSAHLKWSRRWLASPWGRSPEQCLWPQRAAGPIKGAPHCPSARARRNTPWVLQSSWFTKHYPGILISLSF